MFTNSGTARAAWSSVRRRLPPTFGAWPVVALGLCFFLVQPASATQIRLTAFGTVESTYYDSLGSAASPYWDGADISQWVGLPISVEWTIKPQFVPNTAIECEGSHGPSCYANYSQTLGTGYPAGQPFLELTRIILGEGMGSLSLRLNRLENYDSWRYEHEEYLLIDAFLLTGGYPRDTTRLGDVRETALLPSSEDDTYRYSQRSFGADIGTAYIGEWLSSAALIQQFTVEDNPFVGRGGFAQLDEGGNCPAGPTWDCLDTRFYSIISYTFNRFEVRVVPIPSTAALMLAAGLGFVVSKKRRPASI